MSRSKKRISKEEKRLRFIREARERRNAIKYNPDRIFPKKRDISFKNPKSKK